METKVENIEEVEPQEKEQVTEDEKRVKMQEMAREFSLFEESLSLEAQDPLYRTVPEGCSSHSECNLELPCHL